MNFFNIIGRHTESVLKFILNCTYEAIESYNYKAQKVVEYSFKQYPVLLISDIVDDFYGLYTWRNVVYSGM